MAMVFRIIKKIQNFIKGSLSRDELIHGYNTVLNNQELSEQYVDKIMDLVDINRSG